MGFEGIGASVRRKEDVRFLSGRGNYTDDINRPGQLYAVIKRCRPAAREDQRHRHQGRRGSARRGARSLPAPTWRPTGIGGLPCGWQIHNKDGSPMAEPPHPVLAVGKVRHVGDPVAVVIAEPKQEAKNAAELIVVDYKDLPAVADLTDAVEAGRRRRCTTTWPAISATTGTSATRRWWMACFAGAAQVVKLDLINNRLIPNAMEPRAAVGDFDTVHAATSRCIPPARTRT